ncbi:MAG: hypothetical protein AAFY22_13690, partial [Pseudomonadota bacterium]
LNLFDKFSMVKVAIRTKVKKKIQEFGCVSLTFVLIATFTMLNLFVAIVVRVVEEDSDTFVHDMIEKTNKISDDVTEIKAALDELRRR